MMSNTQQRGMPPSVTLRSSTSTDSDRRSSLRVLQPERNYEPPSPSSPQFRLTRKRAASLDAESANHPRIGDLALGGASTAGPSPIDPLRDQVCLCQPDPKIPRPRNAFILYRQHYQAQVVAQHPGLANPEISKIIGEQWREQAPQVKNDWKRLAEEEKQRHQRQYPGYRYQPRRAGKPNGIHQASSSSPDGPSRCPKCNGRYIATPSTPLTPFTSTFGGVATRSEHLPPALYPNSRTPELERIQYPLHMESPRLGSPRMPPPPQQIPRRMYPPSQLHTHQERDEDKDMMSPTPDQKRRRLQDPQRHYSGASPAQYSAPLTFSRGPPAPILASPYRQHSISGPPGIGMMTRPGNMAPPPSAQQSPMRHQHGPVPPPTHRHQYPARANTYDESLRLPPLQTQMPPTPTSSVRPKDPADHHARPSVSRNSISTRESQARSIEAMVMTIPYVNKLRVLNKISPPLTVPGPTSPVQEIRGAVIAVEGSHMTLLKEIGDFINETLSKDPSYAVRIWNTGRSRPEKVPRSEISADTIMVDAGSQTGNTAEGAVVVADGERGIEDPFVQYLSIISDMHKKSSEMVKYITTIPTASSDSNTTSTDDTMVPVAGSIITRSSSTKQIPENISSSLIPQANLQTPLIPIISNPNTSNNSKSKLHSILPIALLPHGFSLTTSDTYSLLIPINDSYAPVDHWQWMATLWRGIIGPDLTVFCCKVGREEYSKFGGVEVRGDVGAIVVRVLDETGSGSLSGIAEKGGSESAKSKGLGGASEGAASRGVKDGDDEIWMDEKTKRRLGFEVLEWVRASAGGEQGGFGRT